MGFKNTNEQFGPGLFFKLENDGDSQTIMFLAEPEPKLSQFEGQEVVQAIFPVWHEERVKVWTTSQRTSRQIEKDWENLLNRPVKVTRHGEKGSSATYYTFKPQRQTKLLTDVLQTTTPQEINKALADAVNISNNS